MTRTADSAPPDAPILLVDDEELALQSYEMTLRYGGLDGSVSCRDPRQALAYVESHDISLAILDLCMPHLGGEELLDRIRATRPDAPVIVVTGENDVETAVRCMRAGSTDYLVKPVDPARLMHSVGRALKLRQGFRRVRQQPEGHDAAWSGAFSHMVGHSGQMAAVIRYISAISGSLEPVLVTGETGVGKEMAAKAIHASSRGAGPFVAVNAAGLDDAVFADTLFGHRKGAFTGAESRREGLIEKAAGGTLFLDEIGDLSLASQLKLLRLLEEREFYPVGSDESKKTDARIIVATNLALHNLLDPARFRRDLFYRLRTHHLHMPSLRERKDDILALAEHFLAQAAARFGKKDASLPGASAEVLIGHDFPGNVRELRAMIFDAVARSQGGAVDSHALRTWIEDAASETGGKCAVSLDHLPTLRRAEEDLIDQALARTGGSQSAAARILGISRQALNKRLLARKRKTG